MSDKRKPTFKIWGEKNNPGRDVANAAWNGTKAIGVAVVAGVALGLGVGAYNSVSG